MVEYGGGSNYGGSDSQSSASENGSQSSAERTTTSSQDASVNDTTQTTSESVSRRTPSSLDRVFGVGFSFPDNPSAGDTLDIGTRQLFYNGEFWEKLPVSGAAGAT